MAARKAIIVGAIVSIPALGYALNRHLERRFPRVSAAEVPSFLSRVHPQWARPGLPMNWEDAFYVDVPIELVARHAQPGTATLSGGFPTPAQAFTKAFFSSRLILMERKVLLFARDKLGLLSNVRAAGPLRTPGLAGPDYKVGDALIEGAFHVESVVGLSGTSTSGPIAVSFEMPAATQRPGGLAGGRHVFAVESLSDGATARMWFVSHSSIMPPVGELVETPAPWWSPSRDAIPRPATKDGQRVPLSMMIGLRVHGVYSRLLMASAIRVLEGH